jgi:hypothetical protein
MSIYGISSERASDILTTRSQRTNIKVRVLAAQLVDEVVVDFDAPQALRSRLDALLLTVHEHIRNQ